MNANLQALVVFAKQRVERNGAQKFMADAEEYEGLVEVISILENQIDDLKKKPTVDSAKHSVEQHRVEMLHSFYDAIVQAGGDPKTLVRLDMTLGEMLQGLAQNGIRFTYDKSKVED